MWHASHPAVPADSVTQPRTPASFPQVLPSPVYTELPGWQPAEWYWNTSQGSFCPVHMSSVCTQLS